MFAGLVLLLLPLLPCIGATINGATLWIRLGGLSFQPGELAKILLTIFFAGYLTVTRDSLALVRTKVLGIELPRGRDLGPAARRVARLARASWSSSATSAPRCCSSACSSRCSTSPRSGAAGSCSARCCSSPARCSPTSPSATCGCASTSGSTRSATRPTPATRSRSRSTASRAAACSARASARATRSSCPTPRATSSSPRSARSSASSALIRDARALRDHRRARPAHRDRVPRRVRHAARRGPVDRRWRCRSSSSSAASAGSSRSPASPRRSSRRAARRSSPTGSRSRLLMRVSDAARRPDADAAAAPRGRAHPGGAAVIRSVRRLAVGPRAAAVRRCSRTSPTCSTSPPPTSARRAGNSRVLLEEYSRERGPILLGSDGDRVVDPHRRPAQVPARSTPTARSTRPATGFYSIVYGATGIERTENAVLSGSDDRFFVDRVQQLFAGRGVQGRRRRAHARPRGAEGGVRRPRGPHRRRRRASTRAPARSSRWRPRRRSTRTSSRATTRRAIRTAYDALQRRPRQAAAQPAARDDAAARLDVQARDRRRRARERAVHARHRRARARPRSSCPNTTKELNNWSGTACGPGGKTTLENALAVSCNTAFASIGLDARRRRAARAGREVRLRRLLRGAAARGDQPLPRRPRPAADRDERHRPVRRHAPPRCRWRWWAPASRNNGQVM